MDLVHRLIEYVESFPPTTDVNEFKDQLSAFTHRDLRAACSVLNLPVTKKQNKKGGFISALASHWQNFGPNPVPEDTKTPPKTSQPKPKTKSNILLPNAMELPTDVAQFVQVFPPDGDVEELQEQLNGYRSRTLRSTCVLLELHPKKNFTKPNFVGLLVNYWKDCTTVLPKTATVTPTASHIAEPNATPRPTGRAMRDAEVEVLKTKRTRTTDDVVVEKETTPKKKKTKMLGRSGDIFEQKEEKAGYMASSLEKAKVVKEWASAIEILSRVDGSAESISSIRTLINGVVESAASEL